MGTLRHVRRQSMSASSTLEWGPSKLGFLAVLGVLGPGLFVASATLLPLFRPDRGFLTNTISSLEIGQYGDLERAALLATGICSLTLALGVCATTRGCRWSRLGSGLIGLWSVSIFLTGIFPGYPESMEDQFFHLVAAELAFLSSVAGILVLCITFEQADNWRAIRRWSLRLGLIGLTALVHDQETFWAMER